MVGRSRVYRAVQLCVQQVQRPEADTSMFWHMDILWQDCSKKALAVTRWQHVPLL